MRMSDGVRVDEFGKIRGRCTVFLKLSSHLAASRDMSVSQYELLSSRHWREEEDRKRRERRSGLNGSGSPTRSSKAPEVSRQGREEEHLLTAVDLFGGEPEPLPDWPSITSAVVRVHERFPGPATPRKRDLPPPTVHHPSPEHHRAERRRYAYSPSRSDIATRARKSPPRAPKVRANSSSNIGGGFSTLKNINRNAQASPAPFHVVTSSSQQSEQKQQQRPSRPWWVVDGVSSLSMSYHQEYASSGSPRELDLPTPFLDTSAAAVPSHIRHRHHDISTGGEEEGISTEELSLIGLLPAGAPMRVVIAPESGHHPFFAPFIGCTGTLTERSRHGGGGWYVRWDGLPGAYLITKSTLCDSLDEERPKAESHIGSTNSKRYQNGESPSSGRHASRSSPQVDLPRESPSVPPRVTVDQGKVKTGGEGSIFVRNARASPSSGGVDVSTTPRSLTPPSPAHTPPLPDYTPPIRVDALGSDGSARGVRYAASPPPPVPSLSPAPRAPDPPPTVRGSTSPPSAPPLPPISPPPQPAPPPSARDKIIQVIEGLALSQSDRGVFYTGVLGPCGVSACSHLAGSASEVSVRAGDAIDLSFHTGGGDWLFGVVMGQGREGGRGWKVPGDLAMLKTSAGFFPSSCIARRRGGSQKGVGGDGDDVKHGVGGGGGFVGVCSGGDGDDDDGDDPSLGVWRSPSKVRVGNAYEAGAGGVNVDEGAPTCASAATSAMRLSPTKLCHVGAAVTQPITPDTSPTKATSEREGGCVTQPITPDTSPTKATSEREGGGRGGDDDGLLRRYERLYEEARRKQREEARRSSSPTQHRWATSTSLTSEQEGNSHPEVGGPHQRARGDMGSGGTENAASPSNDQGGGGDGVPVLPPRRLRSPSNGLDGFACDWAGSLPKAGRRSLQFGESGGGGRTWEEGAPQLGGGTVSVPPRMSPQHVRGHAAREVGDSAGGGEWARALTAATEESPNKPPRGRKGSPAAAGSSRDRVREGTISASSTQLAMNGERETRRSSLLSSLLEAEASLVLPGLEETIPSPTGAAERSPVYWRVPSRSPTPPPNNKTPPSAGNGSTSSLGIDKPSPPSSRSNPASRPTQHGEKLPHSVLQNDGGCLEAPCSPPRAGSVAGGKEGIHPSNLPPSPGRLPPPKGSISSTSLQEAISSRLRTTSQPTQDSGGGDASATASPSGAKPVTVVAPLGQPVSSDHLRVLSGETGAPRRDMGGGADRAAGNSSPRKIKSMMGRLLRGIWNE